MVNNLNEEVIFIFGGHEGQGEDSDLVFEFNIVTGEVIQRQQPLPQPVADGDAALYKDGGGEGSRSISLADSYMVLIFGGESGGAVMNQTWASTQSYTIAAINQHPADGPEVALFPNPAITVIRLQLVVGSYHESSVEVFDMNLIQVMEELIPSENPEVTYDIGHLPQGVYFCRISNGSQSGVRKLVVI